MRYFAAILLPAALGVRAIDDTSSILSLNYHSRSENEFGSAITLEISNGRIFHFDSLSSVPGAPHLKTGARGTASLVQVDIDPLAEIGPRGGISNRMGGGGDHFRAMVNDAENGVVYEFMPNVASGDMVVISRRAGDFDEGELDLSPVPTSLRGAGRFPGFFNTPMGNQTSGTSDGRGPDGTGFLANPSDFGCSSTETPVAGGYKCAGGKISSITFDSLQSCRRRCDMRPDCAALMYADSSTRCFLYDELPTAIGSLKEGAVCELIPDACDKAQEAGTTPSAPASKLTSLVCRLVPKACDVPETDISALPVDGIGANFDPDAVGCYGENLSFYGYRCNGESVTAFEAPSISNCRSRCNDEKKCNAFTYEETDGQCFLHETEIAGLGDQADGATCEFKSDICSQETESPTSSPTLSPTPSPTSSPTSSPTPAPTPRPTYGPTLPNDDGYVGTNMDVMIVWSRLAECANAFPDVDPPIYPCDYSDSTAAAMRATIELAIAESNTVFQNSGIQARLRLVHSYREETWEEDERGDAHIFKTGLFELTDTNDGVMDDVHAKRDLYGADIVSMFTYNPTYRGMCGYAWSGKTSKPAGASKMFSLVDFRCATARYDLLHEIAHNLGAQHDRGTTDKCETDVDRIEFGYRHPAYPFRTVLAYNCMASEEQCDKSRFRVGPERHHCNLLPFFSGPNSKVMIRDTYGDLIEITMGDQYSNNAGYISSVVREVAGYRSVSTLTLSNDDFVMVDSNGESNGDVIVTVDSNRLSNADFVTVDSNGESNDSLIGLGFTP